MADDDLKRARIQALTEQHMDIVTKVQELYLELARVDTELIREGGGVVSGAIGGTIGGTIGVPRGTW